jgi:glutaminase
MAAPVVDPTRIDRALEDAVTAARPLEEGGPATYIPELANANLAATSAAVTLMDGTTLRAGDYATHRFTLQSSAKVVVLAGLLEERGEDDVFSVVGKEPSGGGFGSVARLETHGPKPANPLVNAGAIALCGLLEGNLEDRLGWIETWIERLYGERLTVNSRVLASERRTGDRNRALAYMLKAGGVIHGSVDDVLETYFTLCSFQAGVEQVARLGGTLATEGVHPCTRERVLSRYSSSVVVSLMATCGMYDESGAYLADTGLPAKSGVSGVIVAVAPGRAGIAVSSPCINAKGGSVRGHHMLRTLAHRLGWHFASPGAGVEQPDLEERLGPSLRR